MIHQRKNDFLYRLLTKELYLQNIDALDLFSVFIHQLENSVRQFISMSSSPSTTFDRQVVVIFSDTINSYLADLQSILFETQEDLQFVGSKPFADIYLNFVWWRRNTDDDRIDLSTCFKCVMKMIYGFCNWNYVVKRSLVLYWAIYDNIFVVLLMKLVLFNIENKLIVGKTMFFFFF